MIFLKYEEDELLKVALEAAIAAGESIMKHYTSGAWSVSNKEDCSPLTDADLAAQEIISTALSRAFPDIPSINEERAHAAWQEREQWNYTWLVDPLDGTKEFINHTDEFTVNIALVERELPVLGVVFAPACGELYYTRQSKAWFCKVDQSHAEYNDLIGNSINIRCTRDPFPAELRVVASRSHRDDATNALIAKAQGMYQKVNIVSAGSSLKLCLLAAGKADFYPRLAPTMEWDTAAGDAVLRAAGGIVKVYSDGHDLTYNRQNLKNPGFLAGEPSVLKRFSEFAP